MDAALPQTEKPAGKHHLPRMAIAAMSLAAVFGLGYWTGLPDPGAPAPAPVPKAASGMPADLGLRFEYDIDAMAQLDRQRAAEFERYLKSPSGRAFAKKRL